MQMMFIHPTGLTVDVTFRFFWSRFTFFSLVFIQLLSDFGIQKKHHTEKIKNLQRRIKLKAIKFTMFYVHRIVLKKMF